MRLKSLLLTAMILLPLSSVQAVLQASPGASMRHGLTPEERALFREQKHGANWRSLSEAQRCQRMQDFHRQWANMSSADLQNLKKQLDAEWNSLPSARKQQIEQRISARQTRREQPRTQPRVGGHRCA